jgi:hypothetical protein
MLRPVLHCSVCRDLDRVFQAKLAKYVEACASPFYQVSKELAARKQVNMERAKNDLEEHLLICANPAADSAQPDPSALIMVIRESGWRPATRKVNIPALSQSGRRGWGTLE